MSRIATEELPSPIVAHWATSPLPPVARPPRAGRTGLAIVGGLTLAVVGVLAVLGLRSDDTAATSTTEPATEATVAGPGAAGNSALTTAELDAAYTAVFGVRGSATTLECVNSEIGLEGGQAARLARGEVLTFDEANAAFTPFVSCAPDADFNFGMVPVTMQLFGQQADSSCIEANLAAFAVPDRAEALALALTDPQLFGDRLFSYFQPCAF